jgi:CHASE2 domain-containing sensor protein
MLVLAAMLALQGSELMAWQLRLRAALFDSYQILSPRDRVSAPAVIVDIDEASLKRHGQWPWPRSLVAQLVERIHAAQPAAVGLDLLMPEPDRSSPCAVARLVPGISADLIERMCALPGNDAQLASQLRQARAALSVAGVDRPTDDRLLAPAHVARGGDPGPLLPQFAGALSSLAELHEAAAGRALVSADSDQGVVRTVPLAARIGGSILPSLPIEMLRLASGSPAFSIERSGRRIVGIGVGDLFVPTQADARLWVHYGFHLSDRYIPATMLLEGKVAPERLKNRLVLVGVSGLGLVDFPMTALGERVPGVEVHAQVLESMFDGTTLLRPAWAPWAELAASLLLGAALVFGITRANSMLVVLLVLLTVVTLGASGLALFTHRHLLIDAAMPALVLVLMFGGMLAYELMRGQVERRALESTLRDQREAAARTAGEVAAARRIQLGMVPDARAVFAAEPRLDIAAHMEPAREVGGDLYDCFMLDVHRVFFMVGDVCGKGIPASLFMATSKTLCKSVALRAGADLGDVMREANREICRDNSELLFVTVFAGILDLRTGSLWHASAGHERPWLTAPGQEPQVLDSEGGPPLGIDDTAEFPVSHRMLAADQSLCVCSDGVSEAANAAGDFFGRDRMVSALAALTTEPDADAMLRGLVREVDRFAGGAERSDDVTVMVLRWRGPLDAPA